MYYKSTSGKIVDDIAPLISVKSIEKSVESKASCERWLVDVNDHNLETYEFSLSSDTIYSKNLLEKLCQHGIIVEPSYEDDMVNHFMYEYKKCRDSKGFDYRNKVLGWYPVDGTYYYFYDKTQFGNKHATTSRDTLKFQSGDKATYLTFLRNTVFPSLELSLALSIGYSAVVASRLNSTHDIGTIIVNLCGTSSTGKSTAEMLMCSPFACPNFSNSGDTLCFTANATVNALYALMDGIHGVPFVIDDITTNPQIPLEAFIYVLADGKAKSRCNGDGTTRQGYQGWSGVAITSSEIPIFESIAKNQGLKGRVLHTEGITWTKDANEAELIKRTVRENYGFTGKEFASYVASIPYETLSDRYFKSRDVVNHLMVKKDGLSYRLENKFAVIHLTVELLNEAFNYGLSAMDITERLVRCEQETFEERDNSKKAYDLMLDFVTQKKAHFDVETRTSNPFCVNDTYTDKDFYGKIFKQDTLWEIHMLTSVTDKLLRSNGLNELKWIRKKWVATGLTEGDSDHNSKQKMYHKQKVRCDCFIIKGGISTPCAINEPQLPKWHGVSESQETPVIDYTVDDAEAIKKIFGGNNED